jgi:hypothetical protein
MSDYSAEEIERIAKRTLTKPERIRAVIEGKETTRSMLTASLVAILTGKPPALYLVTGGVRIDRPKREKAAVVPEPCPLEAMPETADLTKLDAEDLGILLRYHLTSQLKIMAEIRGRVLEKRKKVVRCYDAAKVSYEAWEEARKDKRGVNIV